MKCANCPTDLRFYEAQFKLYFFLQSKGVYPREKSPSGHVDLCLRCVRLLQRGRKPSPGLWRRLQDELMGRVKTVAPGASSGRELISTPTSGVRP